MNPTSFFKMGRAEKLRDDNRDSETDHDSLFGETSVPDVLINNQVIARIIKLESGLTAKTGRPADATTFQEETRHTTRVANLSNPKACFCPSLPYEMDDVASSSTTSIAQIIVSERGCCVNERAFKSQSQKFDLLSVLEEVEKILEYDKDYVDMVEGM